jgi:hypothetical protein
MLKAYKVNETGLLAIKRFLAQNHKLGDNFTRENLLAWACDAEDQLSIDNPAAIEIPGVVSVTGNPITFTVPDECLDFAEVWKAWKDGDSEAVEFLVPVGKMVDVAALGADALGVDLSPSINVKRV